MQPNSCVEQKFTFLGRDSGVHHNVREVDEGGGGGVSPVRLNVIPFYDYCRQVREDAASRNGGIHQKNRLMQR